MNIYYNGPFSRYLLCSGGADSYHGGRRRENLNQLSMLRAELWNNSSPSLGLYGMEGCVPIVPSLLHLYLLFLVMKSHRFSQNHTLFLHQAPFPRVFPRSPLCGTSALHVAAAALDITHALKFFSSIPLVLFSLSEMLLNTPVTYYTPCFCVSTYWFRFYIVHPSCLTGLGTKHCQNTGMWPLRGRVQVKTTMLVILSFINSTPIFECLQYPEAIFWHIAVSFVDSRFFFPTAVSSFLDN